MECSCSHCKRQAQNGNGEWWKIAGDVTDKGEAFIPAAGGKETRLVQLYSPELNRALLDVIRSEVRRQGGNAQMVLGR